MLGRPMMDVYSERTAEFCIESALQIFVAK